MGMILPSLELPMDYVRAEGVNCKGGREKKDFLNSSRKSRRPSGFLINPSADLWSLNCPPHRLVGLRPTCPRDKDMDKLEKGFTHCLSRDVY